MSKLKVKFLRYKNTVIAEVLEQDESLRGIGEIRSNGYYAIRSAECPAIYEEDASLYVRGSNKQQDYGIIYEKYVDEYEAKKAIKNFAELINEINSEGEEDKTGEDIEITIAG